jgi:hypothetical protein
VVSSTNKIDIEIESGVKQYNFNLNLDNNAVAHVVSESWHFTHIWTTLA